jgi:hypothetical protein
VESPVKPSRAKCPHGSPWFVECFTCATEVVIERLGIGKVTIVREGCLIRETHTGYWDPKIFPYVQLSPFYVQVH